MSATLDFDTGPLNWVRGEIETALKGAAERIRAYGSDPDLENALRLARDEAHMATGALQMVGLEGAAKVVTALEDVLDGMEGKAIASDQLNSKAVLDAVETILKWVTRMAEGRGEGELALFPTYRKLRELSGAEKIFEGELFYPNLKVQVEDEGQQALDQEEITQRVKAARASFQRGLLAFLRGTKAEAGLAAMRKSLEEVESCVTSQAARAFWWACKGFVDALQNKGIEPDFHVKQLLARVDLQMRQIIEGSPQVAESLMRDALFFIARSKSLGEDSQAVKSAFGLDKYIPKQQMDAEQLARIRPVLKSLKETLSEARNHWHAYSEGKKDSLPSFEDSIGRLSTQAGALNVSTLGGVIAGVLDTSKAMGGLSDDALAGAQLEIATTLLFLQNSVESEDVLDPDFKTRAESQSRRLAAAKAGNAEESATDLMDEGSVKAAERALLAQLGQEIGSSLRQMEESLDAFFRDEEARDGLSSLDMLSAQVQGAMAILEQTDAAKLLQSAMDAVRPYVISGSPSDDEKAKIADALSSLGLFIEAHCAGREDAKNVLKHPQIAFGLAEPGVADEGTTDFFVSEADASSPTSPATTSTETESLESGLAFTLEEPQSDISVEPVATDEAPLEFTAFEPETAPADSGDAVDEVDESLLGLESYAEYVARSEPEEETSAPASDPVTPATTAPQIEQAEIDGELLEIFLEEAGEVLTNLSAAADACDADANDKENLTVIRRAFHTLKGSSRMVGLNAFGEVGWGMEQMMNGWLAAEKPATPALLTAVRHAHDLFDNWIEALKNDSSTIVDASDLLAEASSVGHEPQETEAVPENEVDEVEAAGEVQQRLPEDEPTETIQEEIVAQEPVTEEVTVEEVVNDESVPLGEDEIQIGSVRLSATLYDIFKTESGNWSEVLDEEIERLSESGDTNVSEIAARGVHTLAGISGTTGFPQLANLAHAVEAYIRRLEGAPVPRHDLSTLLDAFTRINSMIENIHSMVVPLQAAPLIYALDQLPEATPEPAAEEPAETVEITDIDVAAIEEPALEVPEMASESETVESIEINVPDSPEPEVETSEAAIDAASEEIELHNIVAQARVQAAPVFENRNVQDEIDPVLLPIFLEEAETLVPEASQALRNWMTSPADSDPPSALRRVLHTLKGSARMAGAMRLGELTHIMESQVIAVLEGQMSVDAAIFEKLEEEFDHLAIAVDHLKFGTPEPEVTHVETEVSDADVLVPPIVDSAEAAGTPETASTTETKQSVTAQAAAIVQPAKQAAAADTQQRETATLRVRSDWVDRMVNQAGEVAIARSRIESEMHALKRQTTELSEALRRLRDHLREVEIQAESQMQATFQSQTGSEQFDPLEFDRFTRFQEVTRFLAESVHDIFTVQQTMASQLGEADAALIQQARMNRELQQNLLRVRMVPLYSVSERLYRVVRQAARDVNKRAQLDIQGGDIEIDRGVLEKIVAPIEHLLRNSIAHGLETPEGRAASNKPEFGEIKLIAKHEGNEMMLVIKDDGAGLNLEKILQKSLERGLLSPGVEPSESQIAQMIFVPGFSTADAVTQVAGRGVGMDVVKNEIAGLGGRVEVATETGQGATFTIYLPLTLAVTQAVSIIANKNEYALPATLVEQVQELKPEQLSAALQARAIEWRGNSYPLFYLPHLIGQPEALHEIQRYNSVVLMKSATSHAALLVDEILGTREVVVKNIGPQVSRVTGIAGATVRGDGKVILILNPVPLAIRALEAPVDISIPAPQVTITEEEVDQAPLVLIVDDSLTVRKITSRLLLREGYRVDTAKDGVEALEKMHDLIPDVVLLDVEMPRMDGFELARVMRNDANLKKVPIIMITSRTADKHRNYALEIGVNVYLGKPYQEAVLLSHIAEQLGDRALISV